MTTPVQPAPTLVIGEALIDVVRSADGSVAEHPGGSPANVAVGLARLGHDVAFATRLGADRYGDAIAAHIAADGVRLTGDRDDRRTSSAQAIIGADGSATYEFDIDWDVPPPSLVGVTHVHTGSIGAVLPPGGVVVAQVLSAARSTATVSYDPNARPALMGNAEVARRQVEELVSLSDVVKASDEDIAWLYPGRTIEEVLSHWGKLGASLTIATRGADGTTAMVTSVGTVHHRRVDPIEVADTVGAGDSFMSGLISGLLDGGLLGGVAARERLRASSWDDLEPAVTRALSCSRITVSRAGANPPRRAELA
jgi:fructokinase